MKRVYLFFGVLLLVAVALLLPPVQTALRDFVIVPLFEVVWFAHLVWRSIPQAFIWGFLIIVVLVASLRTVVLYTQAGPSVPRHWTTQGGLLAPWARLIFQSTGDDYARWRLAQRLVKVAQNVLGGAEPLTPVELRRLLSNNEGTMPQEVRSYLLAGLSTYTPQRNAFSGFGFDWRDRGTGPLAVGPERVVAFLEARARGEQVGVSIGQDLQD